MIRLLRMLAVLYVALLLQTMLAPKLELFHARPDLTLLLVVLLALREGAAGGAIAGFIVGLFVDLNSSSLLGIASLSNSVVGFAIGTASDRLVRTSLVTQFFVALAAVLVRDLFQAILLVPGGLPESFGHLVRTSVLRGLYTAVFAPFVLGAAERAVGWKKSHAFR